MEPRGKPSRPKWRVSENPERSHGLVKSKQLLLKPEILWNTWGELLLMGCTDFKWIDQTLDEIFGGSTTYYRINVPTLSGNLKTCSCHTKLCCLLWPSRSEHLPPPLHIPDQLVCVLTPSRRSWTQEVQQIVGLIFFKTNKTVRETGRGNVGWKKKTDPMSSWARKWHSEWLPKFRTVCGWEDAHFHVGIRDVFRRYLQV